MNFFHRNQKIAWEKEHNKPMVFPHLAENDVSGGVKYFWDEFCNLRDQSAESPIGLEIGCGKGRNIIWLARQGARVIGFDFSKSAIRVAQDRISKIIDGSIHFLEHDATVKWPLKSNQFDFVIDCFASVDIEGENNRKFVVKETLRVLKTGGYLFLYTNSVNSELYQEKLLSGCVMPKEKNAYYYPDMKKFEKVYDSDELGEMYKKFILVDNKMVERFSMVGNKNYRWEHFWIIYKKEF